MPIQRCPRAGLLPMVVALLLGIPCATPTSAQFKLPGSFGSGFGGDAGNPVTVDAQFTGATAQRPAVLMITANIEPGWHVYSLTQPAGGPMKTTP